MSERRAHYGPAAPQVELRCPDCGRALVERTNSHSGETFFGCRGWPDHCQHTEALPVWLVKIRRGDPRLPGF